MAWVLFVNWYYRMSYRQKKPKNWGQTRVGLPLDYVLKSRV